MLEKAQDVVDEIKANGGEAFAVGGDGKPFVQILQTGS